MAAYFQAGPQIRSALIEHHFLHWDSLLVAQADAAPTVLMAEVARVFKASFVPLQRISPVWNDLVVRVPTTSTSESVRCPVGCLVTGSVVSQPRPLPLTQKSQRQLLFSATPGQLAGMSTPDANDDDDEDDDDGTARAEACPVGCIA